MDVSREFKKHPPREDLDTLAAMVRDWKWRTGEGGSLAAKRDDVVELVSRQPNFFHAVMKAVESVRPDGRLHPHQIKVPHGIRMRFGDTIFRVWGFDYRKFKNFDVWHDAIQEIRPKGIGPVTTYDVAVRVGAWLGFEPQSLYLHAGVRQGWAALVDATGRQSGTCTGGRVNRDRWPMELRGMPADEVEDFLCTYRNLFPQIKSAQ